MRQRCAALGAASAAAVQWQRHDRGGALHVRTVRLRALGTPILQHALLRHHLAMRTRSDVRAKSAIKQGITQSEELAPRGGRNPWASKVEGWKEAVDAYAHRHHREHDGVEERAAAHVPVTAAHL